MLFCFSLKAQPREPNESLMRLTNGYGAVCSGVQIKWQQHLYILTAQHCASLENDKHEIIVQAKHFKGKLLRIIKRSETADVIVVEPYPQVPGIEIAKFAGLGEANTIYGFPDGFYKKLPNAHFIGLAQTQVDTDDRPDPKHCLIHKWRKIEGLRCLDVLHLAELDKPVIPGTSGGPVVNRQGQVVGIISQTDHRHSFAVLLKDIRDVLNQP